MTSITFPSTINDESLNMGNYSVKGLKFAFLSDCDSLTSITIADGCNSIAPSFTNLPELVSVRWSADMTTLGNFSGCPKLQRIENVQGITEIPASAFQGCVSLNLFDIPAGVTSIGADAFSGCTSLTQITLPQGVIHINQGTFNGCSNLTELVVPEGVESIMDGYGVNVFNEVNYNGAFAGCTSLVSVSLPSTLKYIGIDAFNGCTSLKTTLPEGVTGIGDNAFAGCTELNTALPQSLTQIGAYAFANCKKLQCSKLPDFLTQLGRGAFYGCSSFTVSEVPAGVKVIDAAFNHCDGITKMWLHKDVERAIGLGGINLAAIDVDAANPYLKSNNGVLFNHAGDTLRCCPPAMAAYDVPEGTVAIGDYAFLNCLKLASITLPSTLRAIGGGAFTGTAFTEIYIPEGTATIGANVFCWAQLQKVSMPSTLCMERSAATEEEIDDIYMFGEAEELMDIKVRPGSGRYYDIEGVLFRHYENGREALACYPRNYPATEYTLPEEINSIGNGVQSARNLNKFTIGEGVKTIDMEEGGDNVVLYECENLQTLVIPSTLESINGVFCLDSPKLTTILSYVESVSAFSGMRKWVNFKGCCGKDVTIYCPDNLVSEYEALGWYPMESSAIDPVKAAEGRYEFFKVKPMSEYQQVTVIKAADETDTNIVDVTRQAVYTLSGQRLSTPTRGFNIIGGRKVIVK